MCTGLHGVGLLEFWRRRSSKEPCPCPSPIPSGGREYRGHPPANAVSGQRVIEPTGIATRTPSIQKVGIVQPAYRARRPAPATIRADSQPMYPVAVVPRPACTEGPGE